MQRTCERIQIWPRDQRVSESLSNCTDFTASPQKEGRVGGGSGGLHSALWTTTHQPSENFIQIPTEQLKSPNHSEICFSLLGLCKLEQREGGSKRRARGSQSNASTLLGITQQEVQAGKGKASLCPEKRGLYMSSSHLIIVVMAMEKWLLSEYHTSQHAPQAPHVQTVVIHLYETRTVQLLRNEAQTPPSTARLCLLPSSPPASPPSTARLKCSLVPNRCSSSVFESLKARYSDEQRPAVSLFPSSGLLFALHTSVFPH